LKKSGIEIGEEDIENLLVNIVLKKKNLKGQIFEKIKFHAFYLRTC
jgi:hypothetical protein